MPCFFSNMHFNAIAWNKLSQTWSSLYEPWSITIGATSHCSKGLWALQQTPQKHHGTAGDSTGQSNGRLLACMKLDKSFSNLGSWLSSVGTRSLVCKLLKQNPGYCQPPRIKWIKTDLHWIPPVAAAPEAVLGRTQHLSRVQSEHLGVWKYLSLLEQPPVLTPIFFVCN